MQYRRMIALCGALMTLALLPAASALAAGTQVRVRVEGKNRTLIAGTGVQTRFGSITKGGAPPGSCPATSAAGALAAATHGRWGGVYSSSVGGLELTSILGEAWPFSQRKDYWSVWVNNRFGQTGMCQITLHRNDHILFAAIPQTGTVYPTGLRAPRHPTAGHSFDLKVVYYNTKGVAKPLAGAHVHGGGLNAVSNKQGVVSVAAPSTGKHTYTASKSGYIRSARLTVRVS